MFIAIAATLAKAAEVEQSVDDGQQIDLRLTVDRTDQILMEAICQASLKPEAYEQPVEQDQSGKGG